MYEDYINNGTAGLWSGFFRRRERVLREKSHRDNVAGLINLLSQYFRYAPSALSISSRQLYDESCGNKRRKPCACAVSIAFEVLPGKNKKSGNKTKKTDYDIREQ